MLHESLKEGRKIPGAELRSLLRSGDIAKHCRSFDLWIWHIGKIFWREPPYVFLYFNFNVQFRYLGVSGTGRAGDEGCRFGLRLLYYYSFRFLGVCESIIAGIHACLERELVGERAEEET